MSERARVIHEQASTNSPDRGAEGWCKLSDSARRMHVDFLVFTCGSERIRRREHVRILSVQPGAYTACLKGGSYRLRHRITIIKLPRLRPGGLCIVELVDGVGDHFER